MEEVGIAVAVLFEGSWGGVELAAVEFDDEFLLAVDGVDFVARRWFGFAQGAAGGGA